jgi:ribosomal protein S18 acetylase RimI-like enzyme
LPERKVTECGCGKVWLETRKINERAVAFYQRHGYRPIPNFGRYAGRAEVICPGKSVLSILLVVAGPQQLANPSVQGTTQAITFR